MEKVNSLNSTQPSSSFAKNRPRSLKYYLSAGLHHKLVGRFAAEAFFNRHVYNLNQAHKEEATEPMNDNSHQNTEPYAPKEQNDNPAKEEQKPEEKEAEEKSPAKAVKYSSVADPGPIANYEQTRSDPAHVKEMVKLSNEVLASASTVFPVDPFPDSIVLDRTTLNITKRTFFFSNDTLSIRIEDILNAHVNVGPFLGSLTIASRVLSSEDHFTVNNLWRKDAIHLKHMIQGYIIALHNEIQISHLTKDELIETISELGHDLNSR